jgi:hypothetical protein
MPIKYVSGSLKPSTRGDKKWQVEITEAGKPKTIHFGAKGYRDFTLINQKGSPFYIEDAKERREVRARYLDRHRGEDWSYRGATKPAFWARHILWNEPTVRASLSETLRKFNL